MLMTGRAFIRRSFVEGDLAVFGHSIISMCMLVQPKDKFLGHMNKGAHGSIV